LPAQAARTEGPPKGADAPLNQSREAHHQVGFRQARSLRRGVQPDARWLATGSNDGTARIWVAGSGQPLRTLTHDHFVNTWNASYSGTGLISGATYTASESKQESWSARQLPASHTTTSVVRLISRRTSNAFVSTTMTTTVDAAGVPTVTVNSVSVTCKS
jgi:WD40 repeat protein